jgi:hypothetical protein
MEIVALIQFDNFIISSFQGAENHSNYFSSFALLWNAAPYFEERT